MTRRQIGLLPRGPRWRGLTLRSGEKEGRVSLQESGLGAMGEVLGCGAGRPVPRNRAGIGDDVNTELSSEGESTFLQSRGPSERGRGELLKEADQGRERLNQEPKGS